MERRFSGNFNDRQSNSVVPIILYLTIPNVTHHGQCNDRHFERRWKSRKQQRRDQKRINDFIESKSVCSSLPFYSLDNTEIKEIIPTPTSTQKFKQAQFYRSEIKKLKQETMNLKSRITSQEDQINEKNNKLSCAEATISDLRTKVLEEEKKLNAANLVISNLKQELCVKDSKLSEADLKIHHLKEMMVCVPNTEEANIIKANELASTEQTLPPQSHRLSNGIHVNSFCESIQGNKKNDGERKKAGPKKRKEKKETKPPHSVSIEHTETPCENPLCANNGLSLTHTASHCRISNQICEGCLAKGHHIIDCPQIGCDSCGSKVGH